MTEPLLELKEVMACLRLKCPWDAKQTPRSLVSYLVEETGELVDAIESGLDDDILEELGDVLLQVYFHAEIAREEGRFSIDDVAKAVCDKLIRRHPHVFSGAEIPSDMRAVWDAIKQQEKQRTSALDGIPSALDPVTRISKMVSRARSHKVSVALPDEAISADALSKAMIELIARAQASGLDTAQVLRDAARSVEATIRVTEGT